MERSGLRFKKKTFTNKGCKIAAQKKLFFDRFCITEQDFFGIGGSHSV